MELDMKCCVNCFLDPDIKEIIEKSGIIGDCDYCEAKSVLVYPVRDNRAISDMLTELLTIFDVKDNFSPLYPSDRILPIADMLIQELQIFNCEPGIALDLLKVLCEDTYNDNPRLFRVPLGIAALNDEEFLKDNVLLGGHTWEQFVETIKHQNRFFSNMFNTDVLQRFFSFITKRIAAGTTFYRARISKNSTGYINPDDMKAPPKDLAAAGRINSAGEPCLYLADSVKTTLHEVRAGIYDFVSVGEFVLKQDIDIINLTMIDYIGPFRGMDLLEYAANIRDLRKIAKELSKPLRRYDSQLDYLPTQFVCDFIKSCGYKGIEYTSTMHKGGANLAVFDESLFEIKNIQTYEVQFLDYRYI
jgi:hypothetical protein